MRKGQVYKISDKHWLYDVYKDHMFYIAMTFQNDRHPYNKLAVVGEALTYAAGGVYIGYGEKFVLSDKDIEKFGELVHLGRITE